MKRPTTQRGNTHSGLTVSEANKLSVCSYFARQN